MTPVALFGDAHPKAPFVFLCEHATNLLPSPLQAQPEELQWLDDHWGWDIGIEDVTQWLLNQTQSVGVFSRFSRLVCDPNRDAQDPTWIVTSIDNTPLSFNQGLDESERMRRQELYYEPYHRAADQLIQSRRAHNEDFTLLAMHSFTPIYRGQRREMEIGVLFDQKHAHESEVLASLLQDAGFVVEHNAPYSGMDGMIYSAWRHGNAHKVRYLELELRQDLIATTAQAEDVASRLLGPLQQFVSQFHGT